MAQKITVRFLPTEYKYYHDYVRIQTDGKLFILVPLHAYPVLNKLDFPRELRFGSVPLCEPKKKVIRLECSIPVDFSFSLEIVKTQPYFHVEPEEGVIPANGGVDVNVTFNPMTLGQCNLQMLLHVGQYGWKPLECIVSAQAVSGLLESRELKNAEKRLMEYIKNAGDVVNSHSTITIRGSVPLQAEAHAKTKLLAPSGPAHHSQDPTATLLASTYGANDLNMALDKVLGGTELLGSKVLAKGQTGVRALDGTLINTMQPIPSGPGAGNVFDAGNLYVSMTGAKRAAAMKAAGIEPKRAALPPQPDRTVEGLRIPPNLDPFPAVNFVLTQEPGKLKPKDLKIAIEKSRAERELRAEEQAKIRAEGGAAGQLDLRGILADERMNLAEGDAFKRQLRELAFLADTDDLAKQEQEKEFRVSEEYLGSLQLSEEDISLIYNQRAQASHHKKVSSWRSDQSRQHTEVFPMSHAHVKAGAPAEVAERVMKEASPSFDPNRNDIWGKRMNTLRRFISLVSRFTFRERIVTRMRKIREHWHQHGAYTREEIRAYIDLENAEAKMAGPQNRNDTKKTISDGEVPSEFNGVAEMVCAAPNDIVEHRALTENVLGNVANRYEFTTDMVRRILFPKFVAEEAGARERMPAVGVEEVPSFDDRTFFPLKVRPEYVSMGYTLQKSLAVPVSFPPASRVKEREGAAEEGIHRPPADANLTYAEMKTIIAEELLLPVPPHLQEQVTLVNTDEDPEFDELKMEPPSWMGENASWTTREVDFFRTTQSMSQVYQPLPRRCEMDEGWLLRPLSEKLELDEDTSLRSQWLREGAFLSANTYLLGGYETRNVDAPPPPGPTLYDSYKLNTDRHYSGLVTYSREHLRALDEDDPDIAALQDKQADADVLSDSESDDEDAYRVNIPSLAAAKAIVRSPEDIAAAEAEAQAKMEASVDSMDELQADPEKPNEQVELLRDRKILELEATLRKQRQDSMSAIAMRLQECADASVDRATSLSFQVPFHMYEEDLLQRGVFESHKDIPAPLLSFHEDHQFAGTMNTAGSPLASPMKTPHP
eukprot:GSChrysophyteH1.ASY1.ANO1.2201.1 assembled CDS